MQTASIDQIDKRRSPGDQPTQASKNEMIFALDTALTSCLFHCGFFEMEIFLNEELYLVLRSRTSMILSYLSHSFDLSVLEMKYL